MEKWLKPALDYIPQWIDFQRRRFELPGVAIAVAERGKVVLERLSVMPTRRMRRRSPRATASASPRIRRASPRPAS